MFSVTCVGSEGFSCIFVMGWDLAKKEEMKFCF